MSYTKKKINTLHKFVFLKFTRAQFNEVQNISAEVVFVFYHILRKRISKQLCNRVRDVSNKKFANVQEKMCSCSNCTGSFSYKLQGIWMLREYDFGFISKYIVCKNYLSYILRDIFICEYEEKKMNLICLEKRTFTRCVGTFPCCYNYFRSGLLSSDFSV